MKPTPLRHARSANSDPLIRAAASILFCRAESRHLKNILTDRWPNDRAVELMTRATTGPATSGTSQWAAEVAALGVASVLDVLASSSAGATLLSRCLQFRFDGTGAIQVHGITADKSNAAFVREGYPIPVRKFDTSPGVLLHPRKFAAIAAFTEEALNHTTPNVEQLVRQVLFESVGLALDDKMFDATADDATRPAGLRAGINAGTASNATVPSEAMSEDVATLVGAVAAVAGNNPIILVASPKQATALRLWSRPNFNYEILSSSGLADKVVLAVASNGLASACDPVPRFELASDAALHFEDTSPRDIDTTAVAATVKSLWQSNLIGLRCIMEVSWGLRSVSGLAWLQNVAW